MRHKGVVQLEQIWRFHPIESFQCHKPLMVVPYQHSRRVVPVMESLTPNMKKEFEEANHFSAIFLSGRAWGGLRLAGCPPPLPRRPPGEDLAIRKPPPELLYFYDEMKICGFIGLVFGGGPPRPEPPCPNRSLS